MNELFQWIVGLIKNARFWQVVLPWERGVRIRFGRRTVLWGPGFHPRIPFFDEVRLVNTRLRIATVPSQTLTTADGRTITIAANVGFRIVDPLAALLRLQQPENTCAAFAQGEFARLIAPRRLDELKIAEIEAAVVVALEPFGGDGIKFDFVRIVEFAAASTFRILNDTWRPNTGHGGEL